MKLRLETLLSKRKAAALRIGPNDAEGRDNAREHVEWRAVEEGFRLLQRDLGKIEVSPRAFMVFRLISNRVCSNSSRSMRLASERFSRNGINVRSPPPRNYTSRAKLRFNLSSIVRCAQMFSII